MHSCLIEGPLKKVRIAPGWQAVGNSPSSLQEEASGKGVQVGVAIKRIPASFSQTKIYVPDETRSDKWSLSFGIEVQGPGTRDVHGQDTPLSQLTARPSSVETNEKGLRRPCIGITESTSVFNDVLEIVSTVPLPSLETSGAK